MLVLLFKDFFHEQPDKSDGLPIARLNFLLELLKTVIDPIMKTLIGILGCFKESSA